MFELPESTKVNRPISKEKFYSKTSISGKLRQNFIEEVEKIVWTNKIAPSTLNITSKDYSELQIFEVSLKGSELSQSVLKHIDTFIPYPIIFVLKKPGALKVVASYKEPTRKSIDQMRVDTYFESGWQKELSLELKGRSVDEIYRNYLFQINPKLSASAQHNTKDAIEIYKDHEKTQKQIDAISKEIASEPSIAKKQELAKTRYNLEKELLK